MALNNARPAGTMFDSNSNFRFMVVGYPIPSVLSLSLWAATLFLLHLCFKLIVKTYYRHRFLCCSHYWLSQTIDWNSLIGHVVPSLARNDQQTEIDFLATSEWLPRYMLLFEAGTSREEGRGNQSMI